jgi:hypothetical protein
MITQFPVFENGYMNPGHWTPVQNAGNGFTAAKIPPAQKSSPGKLLFLRE